MACSALSHLAAVDGGLNHAYVKLDATGLALTDVSIAAEFKHVRYVVRWGEGGEDISQRFKREREMCSFPLQLKREMCIIVTLQFKRKICV